MNLPIEDKCSEPNQSRLRLVRCAEGGSSEGQPFLEREWGWGHAAAQKVTEQNCNSFDDEALFQVK